jgi:hypothetical protein
MSFSGKPFSPLYCSMDNNGYILIFCCCTSFSPMYSSTDNNGYILMILEIRLYLCCPAARFSMGQFIKVLRTTLRCSEVRVTKVLSKLYAFLSAVSVGSFKEKNDNMLS